MASFAFGAGWMFVAATTWYPAGQPGSDLRLLSETAWVEPAPDPGRPQPGANPRRAAAERLLEKYPDLREVPARERGRLLYHKIMADWTAGIPLGIWLGLLVTLGGCVTVSLAETLAAGVLLRRRGRVRSVIGPYIELAVPGAVLVIPALTGGSLRLFGGWFTGHTGQLLIWLLMVVLLVLAIAAVLRGWHWLVRGLLHLGWVGSLTVFIMIEAARAKQWGG
jgi:hypothetical protein